MDEQVARAVEVLRRGGLVAVPTETVYGLAADASRPAAVRRIFEAKGRPADHPLIVHMASAEGLVTWARHVPMAAWALAAAFWPGPLTLVLERAAEVDPVVTGGLDTIAVRVPSHPLTLAILERFGGGIAAPSANRFGHVSPTTADHVRADLGGRVELIVDGGPCRVGIESTIVDLTGARPAVLRLGAVTSEALGAVLGEAVGVDEGGRVRAPGQLASHYAPRAAVEVVARERAVAVAVARRSAGERLALVSSSADADVALPADAEGYARRLYAAMREADALDVDTLLIEAAPTGALAAALSDRLARAAAPRR